MAKKNKTTTTESSVDTGKRPFYDQNRALHRVLPCILVMVAVLLGFFLVLDAWGMNDSPLGHGVIWFTRGLFSVCSYLIPALLLWMGIRWRSDIRRRRAVRRIIYTLLFPILIDALRFTLTATNATFSFKGFFLAGVEMTGPGLLGSLLGYGLWKITSYIGVPVLIALYVVLFLYDFLGLTPASLLEKRAQRKERVKVAEAADAAEEETEPASPSAKETDETPVKSSTPSKKELKKREKEAARARKAAEEAESRRRASADAGYFPEEKEETFDELRRRLDAEQMEIRRSTVSECKTSPLTTYEVCPPKRTAATKRKTRQAEVDIPLPTPEAQPLTSSQGEIPRAPSASPATCDDAARADTVFRSFDPLGPHTVMPDAGNTVLYPAEAPDARDRREILAPMRGGKGGGSFRVRVEPVNASAKSEGCKTSFTHYEDLTRPSVPADPKPSSLPYVHPATQPDTQPQSARKATSYVPPEEPTAPKPLFPIPDKPEERSAVPSAAAAIPDPSAQETKETTVKAEYPVPDPPAKAADTPKKAPNYAKNYLYPPLSLLNRPLSIRNGNAEEEIQEMGRLLISAFATFKIEIQIKEVVVGPRITRFSIEPPAGVRINTLTNLTEDICRLMSSKTLRIESIPETPYLGVEIPNRHPTTVSLASLIDTDAFRRAKTVTTVPLGAGVTGEPIFADICKMPHLLVAGATGMGKSVFVNSILLSLLYRARPDQVKLILVDPKQVEMSLYNGIPHLLIPPVIDAKRAAGALIWAVGEMERRYQLMVKANVRTIESYNEYVRQDPSRGETQPKIIIVIDELNDLMMQAKDAVESSIMRLAQKARAAGIHLILGTQRPSVDVITGTIKANIPSRVALHVTSGTDSRTILDIYGAEKLLNNGDMLVMLAGAEPMRIQSAFASDEEVENVTTFLRNNSGPAVYDEIVSAQIEAETEKYKNSGKKERSRDEGDEEEYDGSIFEDSRFMQACKVAFECGKISTSLLQRKCKLGYGKAASYIDSMQMMGIVSEQDGSKPRELLMSYDQFMEMVARDSHSGD